MKNSQKGFITTLLLVLVAILLIGGGAYVYMQNKPASQPAVVSQTPRTTSTEQTSNSQTANWKTYRNEKYGFEVKYPADWTADLEKNNSIYFHNKSEEMSGNGITVNIQTASLKDVVKNIQTSLQTTGTRDVTFNNTNWEIFTFKEAVSNIEYADAFTANGANTFQIGASSPNAKNLLDTFLSTFKFNP